MEMLYNSDSYAVVVFQLPADAGAGDLGVVGGRRGDASQGGYEIVDKFAGKEIFISGILAESFKVGVEELIQKSSPSEEEIDDYIERFSALMQQPLVLH
jgi:hypothetical protein